MDTASLIKLSQEGDKEAIGLLYSSYSKQMMRIVCHYVTDWQAAQDILHDGFLIIFSRIKQLRQPEKLEYWMAAIMKNLSLQYLKEQDITQLLSADHDIPDVPEFEESISMDELEAMIRRLPTGYQKVFRLAVLEHKSHKEIGKLLGISESTSGSQLFHARAMIRKMIIEHKIEMVFIGMALFLLLGFVVRKGLYRPADTPTVAEATGETMRHPVTAANIPNIEDTPADTPDRQVPSAHIPYIANDDSDRTIPQTDTLSVPAYESETYTVLVPTAEVTQGIVASDTLTLKSLNTQELLAESNGTPLTSVITGHSSTLSIKPEPAINRKSPRKHSAFNTSVSGTMASSDTRMEDQYQFYPSGNWAVLAGTEYQAKYEHDIPITLALSVSKTLTQHVSIESGVQYALLHSKIYKDIARQKVKTQYIGVPLRVRIQLFSAGRLSIYGNGGVMVELPIGGKVTTLNYQSNTTTKWGYKAPVQWSASIGLGAEYSLTPRVGLYAEPSIGYYFKTLTPYPTIRQDRPMEINLPVGIRYKW